VIYAIVFLGSLFGIVVLVGFRILLRQRTIRRFVRSVSQRFESAEQRGAVLVDEPLIEKPHKSPRTSAIELQQVRSLLRSAEKEWKQRHFEDVERILIQALTVHPHDPDVSSQLAKLYLTTNRESKAEAMYRELLQRYDDVSFHANLGLAFYRQGKYVESCYAYQEALNRDAKNPERSAALGRACIAAQRFEEAAPLLEKASAFMTRDIELLHMLAECYLQIGQRDKAEETYRRINKLEPYNEDVKTKMRIIAEEAAKMQEAAAA
jgi:Flp pilus assembly protein TadD